MLAYHEIINPEMIAVTGPTIISEVFIIWSLVFPAEDTIPFLMKSSMNSTTISGILE